MSSGLKDGDYLISPEEKSFGGYEPQSGSYVAKMQDDGNLAIYRDGSFVWGTVQDGSYEPSKRDHHAIMQDDGNFCVYRGIGPMASDGFVWGSIQSKARKG